MKTKKYIVLIVIILILIILCILFGTNTFNFKFNEDDSNNLNQNYSENNNSNLDSSKGWVYDANYNLPTDKESYYGYADYSKLISASDLIVPYINIQSADAKKANQEIYQLYENLIDVFNENSKEGISFTTVEYKTYSNNNILSIVITTESAGTDVPRYDYYTYTFNVDNGKLLTYNEVYKITGFTKNNINTKAKQAITNALKKEYNYEDYEIYVNESINNYKESVENDTINFFIDENQKLKIIVTLEMPIGYGEFNTIIGIK